MPVEEGKAAPAFTLNDSTGAKVSLKDYRGAQGFRDLWKDFAKGTVILGISPDGAASHESFIEKYKLPFTLLSDPDKKVMTKYGAFGEKMMYGKKTMGVIRSTVWVGPDGKVKKHWRRVAKAADHPAKVLETLRG